MIQKETDYIKSEQFIKLKNTIAKIEYDDIILSIFLLTIVRQYLWVIQDNSLSWILSSFLTNEINNLYSSFRKLDIMAFSENYKSRLSYKIKC